MALSDRDLLNAVADDPEVRDAARAFALSAIAQASRLLHNGNPAARLAVIRAVLPTALGSLKQSPQDATAAELREEMDELLAAVRGPLSTDT